MACAFFMVVWYVLTSKYLDYQLEKKSNKLQWRCVELPVSLEERLKKEIDYFECHLEYRILPSSLNKFTRIFGNNYFRSPFENTFKFKSVLDFKRVVKEFKTYGDIIKLKEEEDRILWYEPSE